MQYRVVKGPQIACDCDQFCKHSFYRTPEFFQYYPSLIKLFLSFECVGGAVASWLVRSTPERAVRVRALAGDSVLCSWARHFTLTVPLSTQVYKWIPAICWGNLTKLRGSDLRWTSILSRGSRNTSSRLMLQKPG